MNASGYSGTPLAGKLGIKEGFRVFLFKAPENFWTLFDELSENLVQVDESQKETIDYMHFFVTKPEELELALNQSLPWLKKEGALWISWPKKTANIPSELDKWMVLSTGRASGLVDVKVAAIDETWSGQKFVYRKQDR